MFFYLITLNLDKILNKRYNKFIIKTSDVTIVIAINISYDLYKSIDSSRMISKSLDWKYKDKDDDLKKKS
jgi:cell division protein ZapA (FtsZ GTPase activity inhibitor)